MLLKVSIKSVARPLLSPLSLPARLTWPPPPSLPRVSPRPLPLISFALFETTLGAEGGTGPASARGHSELELVRPQTLRPRTLVQVGRDPLCGGPPSVSSP